MEAPAAFAELPWGPRCALDVIRRVKEKIREIEPGLPEGVAIVPVYDRSELILRSIGATRETLIEIILTVVFVILLFLWHIPSAIIPIVTIPVSVLLAFIPMRWLGLNSNIMSLAGIAISIGVLVDGAIVEISKQVLTAEQAHLVVTGIMDQRQKSEFENTKECQFAIGYPNLGEHV